jgi:hypothetical protein
MRRAILLLSVALCGCGADDQMRVLDTTPEGIEAWAWTQAYSKQAMTEMAQQYCQKAGGTRRSSTPKSPRSISSRAVAWSTASNASGSSGGVAGKEKNID